MATKKETYGLNSLRNIQVAESADGSISQTVALVDKDGVPYDSGNPLPVTGGGGGGGSGGLTNTELRATPVPVSGVLTNTELRAAAVPISATVLGATNDASATTDSGTFSITALIKRGLANWTTLLARIPALLNGRVAVEVLGTPSVARQLAAGVASANTVITAGVTRISVHARGGDIRYAVGSSAQTASATSHYIAQGERLDLIISNTGNIAVIRAGSVDAVLELTELV